MTTLLRAKTPDLIIGLNSSPVIFLNGPRQAGKSTLANWLSAQYMHADYVTLDQAFACSSAQSDPEGFLKSFAGPVIIDEVQLAPELFRAIKLTVDELRLKNPKQANGKFLLTGSTNVLALPQLSEALVGRMQVHSLSPLSVGELSAQKENFITALFTETFHYTKNPFPDFSLAEVVSRATFPEMVANPQATSVWYDDYLNSLVQRDVRDLMEIEKVSALLRVIKLLAARVGTLTPDSTIAQEAGLNAVTYSRYKTLLLLVFLIFTTPPWFNNRAKRLVKSPKIFFTDTALLCHILNIDLETLKQQEANLYGHILENFVASELHKQLSWQPNYSIYHWRTHDQKEVDFVLESREGDIVGIEVKSKLTLNAEDFKHLKTLRELTDNKFKCGVILHHGSDIIQFEKNLYAMPISAMWNLGTQPIQNFL